MNLSVYIIIWNRKAYVRKVTMFYVRNIGQFYRQAAGGRPASTRITTTSRKLRPVVHTAELNSSPQSTEVPYLDHGEPENEPIEKVYVTTLVTPMGLFNYVDGINSKITPKK